MKYSKQSISISLNSGIFVGNLKADTFIGLSNHSGQVNVSALGSSAFCTSQTDFPKNLCFTLSCTNT